MDNVDIPMMWPHIEPCDIPKTRRENKQELKDCARDGREVLIHFHVFEKDDIIELVQFMKQYEKTRINWELIEVQEKYPRDRGDGFLIVLKVGNMDADSVSGSDRHGGSRKSLHRKKSGLLTKLVNSRKKTSR